MEARQPINSIREGIGLGLTTAAASDSRVVVVSANLASSTKVDQFEKMYPDRFIEVGVAEQNAAGVAAGLALAGKRPIVASFAAFSPGLNLAVIRTSICYSNLPVIILGGHAGLSDGPDGATHQALEDIAIMRTLPNMTVLAPSDGYQAFHAVQAALQMSGPVYLRSARTSHTDLPRPANWPSPHQSFSIGSALIERPGTDATILTTGSILPIALLAADTLADQLSVRVINFPTIKPLDKQAVLTAFGETRAVLTVEDHQIDGGFGSAVAEIALEMAEPKPFKRLGISNTFGESGKADQLYQKYGLTPTNLAHQVQKLLD